MQSIEILKGTIFEGLGINPVIHDRCAGGVEHDPRSEDMYAILEASDWVYGGDYFQWSKGGDGDNGETLMYGIDCYFWALDHGTLEDDRENIGGGPKDVTGRPVEVGDILLFGETRYEPYDQSFTVERLEKVNEVYWYAYGKDGLKMKVKNTVRPFRIGLQWRGILPDGPFEVGDYVVSEFFAPDKVQRVQEIHTIDGGPMREGVLYNVHATTHIGPPEYFRFATKEEIEKAGLHRDIPTRFS